MSRSVLGLVLVASGIAGAWPTGAAAQECLEQVGRWGWGRAGAVAFVGDTMVFGSGAVLVLADVSDPDLQMLSGHLTMSGEVTAIAAAGDVAVVGTAAAGIWLVDVADRSAPRLLARVADAGALAVADDLLVVNDGGELTVLDLAAPEQPALLSRISIPGSSGVVLAGGFAYVGFDRLTVVDLTDPARPEIAATLQVDGVPESADHDLLALRDAWVGTRFVDVADPRAPVEVGLHAVPYEHTVVDVLLSWPVAYIIGGPAGAEVVDITDPATPEVLATGFAPNARALALRGGLLAVASVSGVVLVDVAAPGAPRPVGRIVIPDMPRALAAAGDVAWVVREGTPPQSELLRLGPPPTHAGAPDLDPELVATDGRVAVLVSGTADGGLLTVLDVEDPSDPTTLATTRLWDGYGFPELALDRTSGAVALASHEGDGSGAEVLVVDLADPSLPSVSATFAYAVGTHLPDVALAVDDGLGAVAADGFVTLLDLRDPAAPVEGGRLELEAYRLAVSDGLVLVLDGSTGLTVIDGSDPAAPVELARMPFDYALELAAADRRAFVREADGMVRFVDLTEPTRPVERAHRATRARTLEVAGNLLVTNEAGDGIGLYSAACSPAGALVADFTFSPEPARIGQPVVLTDVSTGTVTERLWELPDGTTTREAQPEITFTDPAGGTVRLTVSDGERSASAARHIAVRPAPAAPVLADALDAPYHLVVPAVGLGWGEGGTHWRSRLTLTNPGAAAVHARAYLLEAGVDGTAAPGLELTVPAHGTLEFGDVLGHLFGRSSGTGAVVLAADAPLAGASEVDGFIPYVSPGIGQGIPVAAYVPGDPDLGRPTVWALPGVREDAAARSNLGLVNLHRRPVTVLVELFAADGTLRGSAERTLAPYSHLQDNGLVQRLAGGELAGGWLRVTGPPLPLVLAYLSVVDNRTGDPAFTWVPPVGDAMVVPVAAHTPGFGGTLWRTDLALANTGADPIAVSVAVPGHDVPPLTVSLPPFGAARLADVLGAFPESVPAAVPLHLAASAPTLAASSRTFTVEPVHGGTFGQAIPALPLPPADAASRGACVLAGLAEDAGRRTNLGVTNLGAEVLTVRLRFYDRHGVLLGQPQVELGGWGHLQLNRVLAPLVEGDVAGAWAVVDSPTPGGRFVAYASVVDNVTGDPRLRLDDAAGAWPGAAPPPRAAASGGEPPAVVPASGRSDLVRVPPLGWRRAGQTSTPSSR